MAKRLNRECQSQHLRPPETLLGKFSIAGEEMPITALTTCHSDRCNEWRGSNFTELSLNWVKFGKLSGLGRGQGHCGLRHTKVTVPTLFRNSGRVEVTR